LDPDPLLAQPANPLLAEVLRAGAGWVAAARGNAMTDSVIARFSAALVAAGAHAVEYPSSGKIAAEIAYARLRPFTLTWIFYIAGGILVAIAMGRKPPAIGPSGGRRDWWMTIGVALTLLGMAMNIGGLGVRVYITSLGAVTNLYETLVYVALLCAGLGLVFARMARNGLYAVAGGVAGGLCAMVGEAIPPDLGSHIGQLQPVLRSKFWLWTHVKVVVGSYAAFLLAWGLGNLVMARAAWRGRAVDAEETRMIYRCLQVGVVLIAAGTLLGAVWADKAWGRFWGWDPKEVWALVILLVYLIPLHLRYVGVVGPTGLAIWSVLGFLSVVMSWYGVNFLLGTGLHAYAFGNGGQEWVLSLCALQVVVTIALTVRLKRYAAAERDLPLPSPGSAELPPPTPGGHSSAP
ncbi:MAG: cytochrome c biogenesis protein CcsA, partial [Planctomycetes bacterium]|nr:cytochrome c biogenesis protein CcsA [Planctomycetota bacterium]